MFANKMDEFPEFTGDNNLYIFDMEASIEEQYKAIANDVNDIKFLKPEQLDETTFDVYFKNGGLLANVPEAMRSILMYEVMVRIVPNALRLIPAGLVTESMCVDAVRRDYMAILDVKHITPGICAAAVCNNAAALGHIAPQYMDLKMCLFAVRKDGMMLRFVPEHLQTSEVCDAAILNCPAAASFVITRRAKKFKV